ncbi:MAG: TonB-dependent receptor [Acidobacteria bacterium]|nr:TonB-dependent receptor [Acidobacteriota bacterium]
MTCFRHFLLLLAAALPALAQFDTAAVLGTVTDASGAAVARATLTLKNTDKGVALSTKSLDNGNFEFPTVAIGTYTLAVEQAGFQQQISRPFGLAIGARQRVDFRLAVATAQTTVEVAAEVNLLETDSSDRGQRIESKQIRELPLNGRAYSELVYLSAGVVRSPSSNQGYATREGSFVANGLRSTFNNFLLDGLDNNYFGTSNQGFSNQVVQVSPDAVEEFRVITNNMSAEYGRSGGATINASLKSGGNSFHGSAWNFLRNTELNAIGFFRPATGQPRLNRNQFGFVFGGPIIKNKTFFFLDYEGYREVNTSNAFATVPSLALRGGNVGLPVRNPFSGVIYPNNVIPASDIIPFARTVAGQIPAPTNAAAANNFQTLYRITDYRDKGDAKVDHYFSEKLRGFFRYSQSRLDVFDPGILGGPTGGEGNGFTKVPIKSFAGGATWALDTNTILEARLGYSTSDAGKDPPLIGGPSMLEAYGITGLPTEKRYTGGLTVQSFVGFTGLGRQATNPQFQHPTTWNPKFNFTRILGRQTLKAGVEYQHLAVEALDVNPVIGRDIYSGLFTLGAPSTQTSLFSFADFLLGARSQYQLVNPAIVNHRQQALFFYVQDDIRLTRKLTLNLGLRYELATPFYERDNRLTNWDAASNSMVAAKDGSFSERGLVNLDKNNFGPRIGLAYTVTPKTVLRAGYGVSYVHFNRTGTSYLAYNAPNFILASVSQSPNQPGFRNTQQGYPEGFTDGKNFNPLNSTVQYIDPKSPSGSVQSYFVSVQRELPNGWLVDLGYVGNKANDLIIINDLNQARPNRAGENIATQLRRPNQRFSSISATLPWAWSNYNGLQIKVEKRSSAGFYFLNSFTWSKAMDLAGQALDTNNGNAPSVQNIFDLNADKGPSNYDRKFNNVTSFVYDLPFGRGRKFMSNLNRAADLVLGGWQVNSIINLRSGAPLTLSYTPSAAQEVVPVIAVFGRNTYRPDVSRNPLAPEGSRSISNYLDRSAVSIPAAGQSFGNSGRNLVRGFNFYQTDLTLGKTFTLTERLRLQFRAEAFNLLNETNFREPDGNISNPGFGQIRSSFDPRQLQFALKLIF